MWSATLLLPLSCRSLALVGDDEIANIDGTLKALNCSKFASSLPDHVMEQCRSNAFVLSAVTKGVRRALSTCQSLLRDSKWSCTTFTQQYLLGKAVETKGMHTYSVQTPQASGLAKERQTAHASYPPPSILFLQHAVRGSLCACYSLLPSRTT